MKFKYHEIELNYDSIGQGKPILLIHGLGCDLRLMKACMEPVFINLSGYKRIYIDLPGMGESTASLNFARTDKILELLLSFIKNIIKEPFLLAGESYGGYLSLGILSKLKKYVDGLFLLCPVVIPNRKQRTIPDNIVKFYDEDFLQTLSKIEYEAFTYYAIIANQATYKRYKEAVFPGLTLANNTFIQQLEHNYTFSFDLNTVDTDKPISFICGKQDFCVGYEDQWELSQKYHRGSFFLLDSAGHNLQLEQPEIFEAQVRNWLFLCQI